MNEELDSSHELGTGCFADEVGFCFQNLRKLNCEEESDYSFVRVWEKSVQNEGSSRFNFFGGGGMRTMSHNVSEIDYFVALYSWTEYSVQRSQRNSSLLSRPTEDFLGVVFLLDPAHSSRTYADVFQEHPKTCFLIVTVGESSIFSDAQLAAMLAPCFSVDPQQMDTGDRRMKIVSTDTVELGLKWMHKLLSPSRSPADFPWRTTLSGF